MAGDGTGEDCDDLKLFRVLVIGGNSVGKSCVVLRFTYDCVVSHYRQHNRFVELDGNVIKLQIWDTAGQERFLLVWKKYYRQVDGIIVMYDVTDQFSFTQAKKWLDDTDMPAKEDISKLLVGNKSDLDSMRVVDYQKAKAFADEIGIPFLETSAKNSSNVEQAFMTMAAEIKNRMASQPMASRAGGATVRPGEGRSVATTKSSCC
eukprot:gene3290-3567_t